MVATKAPSLAECYAALCSFLKTNPKLTVVVSNHIAAKHGIHSLPAFQTTDAVSEPEKLVTYGEIIRAISKRDYSNLRGQVANGQASAAGRIAQAGTDARGRCSPTPTAEPKPRVVLNDPDPAATSRILDPLAEKKKAGYAALRRLKDEGFIGEIQFKCVLGLMRGDEREFFFDKMIELIGVVDKMPKTYENREQAQPLAYLHYFVGGCDWYISEKDKGSPDDAKDGVPPQSQAYGLANLGDDDNAEMGYISLAEVLESNAELDFNWQPKPIERCKPKRPAPTVQRDTPAAAPATITPTGDERTTGAASVLPVKSEELHRYLDHCIQTTERIPGATISIHISLPTHV